MAGVFADIRRLSFFAKSEMKNKGFAPKKYYYFFMAWENINKLEFRFREDLENEKKTKNDFFKYIFWVESSIHVEKNNAMTISHVG